MKVAELLNCLEKEVARAQYVLVSRHVIADALRDPAYDSPLGPAAYVFCGLPTPEEQWERGLRTRRLFQVADIFNQDRVMIRRVD